MADEDCGNAVGGYLRPADLLALGLGVRHARAHTGSYHGKFYLAEHARLCRGEHGLLLAGGGYCPVLYSGRGILHLPHENRNLVDKNRFIPYIEQGKHSFSFRLTYDKRDTLKEKPVWV